MSTSNNIDSSGTPLPVLGLPGGVFAMVEHLVRPTWESDLQIEGALVRLYRDYVEGRQRSFLTAKQRAMLNIKTVATEQLFMNYCDMVVQTMADRLTVTSIEGDTDDATTWSSKVLAYNRFDGLQMDATDATLGDGVSYLMVAYNNDDQMPTFSPEPAWDGTLGMIAIYDRMLKTIVVAIKVWYENSNSRRVNLYWPDRVEKFVESSTEGGESKLVAVLDEKEQPLGGVDATGKRFGVQWVDRAGKPLGVPVQPFRNRAKSHRTTGRSELAPVIPLQDALNRTMIDTIMASGLTAFQIKVALGFNPPDAVAPGDWVVIGGDSPPTKDQQVGASVLEQGQIVPFISQMSFFIDQIGTISRTPLPDVMGADSSSGEALKQREAGLIAKVGRFQVKAGNDYEDLMAMAAKVQEAFGSGFTKPEQKPPTKARWSTKWKDAQVRNDGDVIDNALKVAPLVGDQEALRQVGKVYGYDDQKIKDLLAEKAAQRTSALAGIGVPPFGNFGAN